MSLKRGVSAERGGELSHCPRRHRQYRHEGRSVANECDDVCNKMMRPYSEKTVRGSLNGTEAERHVKARTATGLKRATAST